MKLIYAIVRDEDDSRVMGELNRHGFKVTKLATTGGFLRAGNTTLICGTEEEHVEEVIGIIREECQTRKTVVTNAVPTVGMNGYPAMPVTVDVGGATIFVLDVERFERV